MQTAECKKAAKRHIEKERAEERESSRHALRFGALAIGIIDKNNQLSAQNDVPKIAMQYHYKALQRAFGIIME